MFGNLTKLGASGAAAILVATAPSPVAAQSENTVNAPKVGAPVLEEIIVTSRRYAENIQNVPLANQVMTMDYIEKQHVTTIDQIMALTPGATFTFFNKVNPEASMRGLQTATPGNATSESGIQLLVDDVVISKDFMRARPIFDLQRVEVLRGPQGTAFGRNASIGAIQFISRRPTRDFETSATVTAGVRNLYEADGFISGPLSDTLSARFAFNFDNYDGDMEDTVTGKGLGGTQNFAFRAGLLYEPTNELSVYLKVEYAQDNDDAPVRRSRDCRIPQILAASDPRRGTEFIVPTMPPYPISFTDPCDPFKTEISPGRFPFNRELVTASGEVQWEIADNIMITSVTGFVYGKSDGLQDAIGTPVNILFQATHNDGYEFTQELRVDNHTSGDRLRWLGGFFFLNDEEDRFEENRFFQPNADGSGGLPFPRVPTRISETQKGRTNPSIAIFGELSYDLTPRLTATLGGRWTRDHKTNIGSASGFGFAPLIAGLSGCTFPNGPIVCADPANPAGFPAVRASKTFRDFSAKGSLELHVTDDHMIYLLGSQGFRSGGFQPDPRQAEAARIPFEPERTLNFEIGWKGDIARQLRFALDGFWTRLKNTQVNQFISVGTGFFQLFANAGRVRSIGLEGDMTWLIRPDLRIGATGAVMDVELRKTFLNVAAGAPPVDFSGTRPDGAAKWTATGFAEYSIDIADGSRLTMRTDLTARSDIFDDVGERPERRRPSLTQLGVRVEWLSSDERYSVAIWGRNLTEDEDIANIGPSQPNTLQPPIQFVDRRLFGGTISIRY